MEVKIFMFIEGSGLLSSKIYTIFMVFTIQSFQEVQNSNKYLINGSKIDLFLNSHFFIRIENSYDI